MSHVYTVTLADERTLMHVESDSKSEARRVALANVQVKRLNAGEVIDLMRRGIAIVSAETGEICNAPADADGCVQKESAQQ